MRNCERFDISAEFEQKLLAKLAPVFVPSLRHLHLYSTNNDLLLRITPSGMVMKQLTSLKVDKNFEYSSFKVFTVLPCLEKLELVMDITNRDVFQHPQDIHVLSLLKDLRELKVKFWQLEVQQRIEELTQITSLQLLHLHGDAMLVRPAKPMPGVKDVAITDLTFRSDKRYKEDSKLARWCLGNTVEFFPDAEVIHVGILGSAPACVRDKGDLPRAAEMVDEQVRMRVLGKKARNLKYLQLDTVLNIKGEKLEKKCQDGGMDLSARVVVGGGSGGGAGGCWERHVDFTFFINTLLTVAEFHYSLEEVV